MTLTLLTTICLILTGVLCLLYERLINFKVMGLADELYAITYSVLFFQVTFLSHTYERSKVFKIFGAEFAFRKKVQKRKYRRAQIVLFLTGSNDKRVHCMWILFVKFEAFFRVVSVIVTYVIIMAEIK